MSWLDDTLSVLHKVVLLDHRVAVLEKDTHDAQRDISEHGGRIIQLEQSFLVPFHPINCACRAASI